MEREISKKVTGLGTSLAQVPFRVCGRPHSGCWKRLKMSCFGCSRCPKHRLGLMPHRLWGTAGDCPQNLTLLLRSSSSGLQASSGMFWATSPMLYDADRQSARLACRRSSTLSRRHGFGSNMFAHLPPRATQCRVILLLLPKQ